LGRVLRSGSQLVRSAYARAQPGARRLCRARQGGAAGAGAALLAHAARAAPRAAGARRRRARGARRLGLRRRRACPAQNAGRRLSLESSVMLGRLMPREGKFFDLFNAHAERIVEGARELAARMSRFDEHRLEAHAQRIDDAERAAYKITHETITLLPRTFITPFDREQIHALITRMDDIL